MLRAPVRRTGRDKRWKAAALVFRKEEGNEMTSIKHPFGLRELRMSFQFQGWGFSWQIGGREWNRDAIVFGRLVFLKNGDYWWGRALLMEQFEGGLLYEEYNAGKLSAWQIQGPWKRIR
jgi:hypothetical protein